MRCLVFCLTAAYVLAGASAFSQPKDMLDVKIGQMILIGFPTAQVDTSVLSDVRAGKVGSIILFEKNVPKSTASFTALKKMIWTYQKAASIPLLVSIDQEGGKVNRLKDKYGFARSITAQDMGRAGSLDSVRFYSESTAATLAGLGINVNFAPCVDLAIDKENFIYKSGRTFSANPDSVALMAQEFIKAHKRFGVITALKHFPGHGSSTADTHFGVADVTSTWTPKELVPYERLIAGPADAIMTSHIVNRKLDPRGYPATLSSRIIDSLLRKQMHYNGVVFSDDMNMKAIADNFKLEEILRLAINAGVDIMCFSNNIAGSEERAVDRIHRLIKDMVKNGQISEARIDQSFNRIMTLKSRLGVSPEDYLRSELLRTQQELEALKHPKPGDAVTEEKQPGNELPPPAEEEKAKKKKRKRN